MLKRIERLCYCLVSCPNVKTEILGYRGRKILMKTISLFSGCGGFDIGAENAGAQLVLTNDVMLDAYESLCKYLPHSNPIQGSIADIYNFPAAELVIGGYPCQSFSMGGNRNPSLDAKTHLYQHFARCLEAVQPKYFIAENVNGLRSLRNGKFLNQQISLFRNIGEEGYHVFADTMDAKDFGVPQARKRVFIVGIRRDLKLAFEFPYPTHGKVKYRTSNLKPYVSHGDAIKHLPLWPSGEFYERNHDPDGHWSWYYMSRNRKRRWDAPSYTIVANWRHVTVHPASPVMKMTWSNLEDGFKQRWDFSDEYEHIEKDPSRPKLEIPRRLSWRECAAIQTFPDGFEPVGNVQSKFRQIGNAVPPLLSELIVRRITDRTGLIPIDTNTQKPISANPDRINDLPLFQSQNEQLS